jgi:hypothetical protein
MLDFSQLKTPPGDGDVLVAPDSANLAKAVSLNATALGACDVKIAGTPLSQWRRTTRERFLGVADQPVIVTGHQPAFIHPGVWAKHLVAQRLADAIGGRAVNLVVDNDSPNETTVSVAAVKGGEVSLSRVSFASLPAGQAYEQLPLHGPDDIARLRGALEVALGARYASTQFPTFFSGFAAAEDAKDWVDQAVSGRRAVEAPFGVDLLDRRVSRFCWEPLLVELITNSERFVSSYNNALAEYRRRYRVRGHQRPIPDLAIEGNRRELPVWAYRKGEVRRRVYVTCGGATVRLDAEGELIAELACDLIGNCDRWPMQPGSEAGWMLRPRALTLTLWARLFLSDIFVHGIGGAKYDRITDLLISDYFGITPPTMACVSATLWLDLPRRGVTKDQIREQERLLRDVNWNPQRYLGAGSDVSGLIAERNEAIALSERFRAEASGDRRGRRAAFERIRRLNSAIKERLKVTEGDGHHDRTVADLLSQYRRDEISRGREFFFGLYSTKDLERLVDALPDERSFRV